MNNVEKWDEAVKKENVTPWFLFGLGVILQIIPLH